MNPEFSIVIPARDEELELPKCLAALRSSLERAGSPPSEIIVVLNRCTDRTEQIALEHGCRIAREDAPNLAAIRNAGAKATSGRRLVFVDADSRVSNSMVRAVSRTLDSGHYVGGGMMMFPERFSLGIILTYLALVPIALRYRILAGCFFCGREHFEAIGGFDEKLVSVEDIDFARRLKAHGRKKNLRFATLFSAYIVTSCRKFDRFGDWFVFRNPMKFIKALRGYDRKIADEIWYDFPR